MPRSKHPRHLWRDEEDETLIKGRMAGLTAAQIAQDLPHRTPDAVEGRTAVLRTMGRIDYVRKLADLQADLGSCRPLGTRPRIPAVRRCLGCEKNFASKGAHNRLCGHCAKECLTRFTAMPC